MLGKGLKMFNCKNGVVAPFKLLATSLNGAMKPQAAALGPLPPHFAFESIEKVKVTNI